MVQLALSKQLKTALPLGVICLVIYKVLKMACNEILWNKKTYNDEVKKQNADYLFKIVLVGEPGVGKSNLIKRYTQNKFDPNSNRIIGVEFRAQRVEMNGKCISVHIWDQCGQSRYKAAMVAYYKRAVGAIVVYDITNRQTFDNIAHWLDQLNTYSTTDNLVKILVGNKTDLSNAREVNRDEGLGLAQAHDMFFIETSALDSSNVDDAFNIVVEEKLMSILAQEQEQLTQ